MEWNLANKDLPRNNEAVLILKELGTLPNKYEIYFGKYDTERKEWIVFAVNLSSTSIIEPDYWIEFDQLFPVENSTVRKAEGRAKSKKK